MLCLSVKGYRHVVFVCERLPTTLIPSHYALRLQPHIYGNDSSQFFFEGDVTITFNCTEDTNVITLHQGGFQQVSGDVSITFVLSILHQSRFQQVSGDVSITFVLRILHQSRFQQVSGGFRK